MQLGRFMNEDYSLGPLTRLRYDQAAKEFETCHFRTHPCCMLCCSYGKRKGKEGSLKKWCDKPAVGLTRLCSKHGAKGGV